jgi:hypothetical protein
MNSDKTYDAHSCLEIVSQIFAPQKIEISIFTFSQSINLFQVS